MLDGVPYSKMPLRFCKQQAGIIKYFQLLAFPFFTVLVDPVLSSQTAHGICFHVPIMSCRCSVCFCIGMGVLYHSLQRYVVCIHVCFCMHIGVPLMLCHLMENWCSDSFIRLPALNVDHQQHFPKGYIIGNVASNQKPMMAIPL